jgi:hypothetical protein
VAGRSCQRRLLFDLIWGEWNVSIKTRARVYLSVFFFFLKYDREKYCFYSFVGGLPGALATLGNPQCSLASSGTLQLSNAQWMLLLDSLWLSRKLWAHLLLLPGHCGVSVSDVLVYPEFRCEQSCWKGRCKAYAERRLRLASGSAVVQAVVP